MKKEHVIISFYLAISHSGRRASAFQIKANPTLSVKRKTDHILQLKSSFAVAPVNEKEFAVSDSERTIRPWPRPVIHANGDYRGETFLEKHIGGELYEHQESLPLLPVPSLANTIKQFLPTALPLAESKEEEEELKKKSEDFLSSALTLKQKLEEKASKRSNSSWLQDWWNQVGYLQLRDPIVINISYFFPLEDDDTLNMIHDERPLSTIRGACALTALANYRKKVCSGQLAPERIGSKDTVLCSAQYKYHMHSSRIPKQGQDYYVLHDPSLYKHCIVSYKGQFFSMYFVDDNDNPLSLSSLQKGLQKCIELANLSDTSMQLGFLTTSDRDLWAKNRNKLLNLPGFQKGLEAIESAAAIVCLDDSEPTTLVECIPNYWHGGRSKVMNRWFDKPIQLVIQQNGKMAYMGEHSLVDGMPTMRLCDAIVDAKYCKLSESNALKDEIPLVHNIFSDAMVMKAFATNDNLEKSLEKAKQHFYNLVDKNEMTITIFAGFGQDFLIEASIVSDAFMQMAIQLASYRLFGQQVAVYESSQVRPFRHGRTETTRSVSPESKCFVESMGTEVNFKTDDDTANHQFSLLKKAMWAHSKYLNKASKGLGCDRHFFGLSMCRKDGEKAPPLFNDELFQRSKYWKVSSSTCPHVPGFGCVVDDGIGVGYSVKSKTIEFTVAGRKENQLVHTFSNLLEESLAEIKVLIERSLKIEE